MRKTTLLIMLFGAFALRAQVIDLPITFDDPTVAYDVRGFDGATDTIVADPTNATNSVLKLDKSNTAQLWAGAVVGDFGLANAVPFSAGNNIVTMRVWSPDAGIQIRMKIEDAANPGVFVETVDSITTASVWETLSFDFSNVITGSPINYANTYDKVVVFPNFGTTGAIAGAKTYYFDDIMFAGGAPMLTQVDLPINFNSATVNYEVAGFGGVTDTIVADPTNAANMVLQLDKDNTAQTWAGAVTGDLGLANAVPFSMNNNILTMRVWSPDAGIEIRMKIEDATNAGISVETVDTITTAGAWETLTFDFSNVVVGSPINYANTYDKVVVFPNFGVDGATAGAKTYYFDDITFGSAAPMLTQVDLPITFNSATVNYEVAGFGGVTDTIVTDPTNAANMVLQLDKDNTAQTWAGAVTGDLGLANAVPFSMNNNILTMRVWSPDAGIEIRMKIEDATNGAVSVETVDTVTTAGVWETLTFDFSNVVVGSPINYANTYDKVVVFPNFGVDGATAGAKTYYFDDITFGTAAPQLVQMDLPITFDDPTVNYASRGFDGATDSIIVDPTDPTNMVSQIIKDATAQTWAGIVLSDNGLANPIPFTATDNTMSMRVWSPDAGIEIRLKAEDQNDPTISVETNTMTTVAGAWETLVFDFSTQSTGTAAINYASTYDQIAVFMNFGVLGATVGAKTYYIDDVMFGGAVNPGSQLDLPITFDDAMLDYSNRVGFGGCTDTLVADPTNASNNVLQINKDAGAQTWGGITVTTNGLANAIPFSATATSMKMRVWSPAAGTDFLLKVEQIGTPAIAVETMATTTVAAGWDTLYFDFANHAAGTPALDINETYDVVVVFPNFGVDGATAGAQTYYIDDIMFGSATIGLNENAWASELSVSPNPSAGIVRLAGLPTGGLQNNVIVSDLNGRQVLNTTLGELSNQELDLSHLNNGVYILTVSDLRSTESRKIIITK